MSGNKICGSFDRMAIVVQQLVVARGFVKVLAHFRISHFVKPVGLAITNLQHAPNGNAAVFKLSVKFAEDMASQKCVRAPGKNNYQERERKGLLKRQPESKAG